MSTKYACIDYLVKVDNTPIEYKNILFRTFTLCYYLKSN